MLPEFGEYFWHVSVGRFHVELNDIFALRFQSKTGVESLN